MVGNFKTVLFSDTYLALFDFRIKKLFDLAAIQANQMVMVRTFIQFEHGLAGFKVIALQ